MTSALSNKANKERTNHVIEPLLGKFKALVSNSQIVLDQPRSTIEYRDLYEQDAVKFRAIEGLLPEGTAETIFSGPYKFEPIEGIGVVAKASLPNTSSPKRSGPAPFLS